MRIKFKNNPCLSANVLLKDFLDEIGDVFRVSDGSVGPSLIISYIWLLGLITQRTIIYPKTALI